MGEISVGEPCHNWMPEHVRRRMRAQLAALLFPPVKGLNACKCPASWLVWSDHCSSPAEERHFLSFQPRLCVSRSFLTNPIDDYTRSRLNTRLAVITPSKWMKLMVVAPNQVREFSCSSNLWLIDGRCSRWYDGIVWRYREINRWRGRLNERKERSLLNLEIGYLRNVD